MRRIGLLGGTFDPVHFGHLILAEQCREQCRLDEVWFLPSGQPPHKLDVPITDGSHRVAMLKLAIAGHPSFRVDDLELNRSGPTYTVETLTQLHTEHTDVEYFFLFGGDSLTDLPSWREPNRIAELALLVAVNRGDRPHPHERELMESLGERIVSRLHLAVMPGIDISATDIRCRVGEQRSIRYLVPRAVEEYILQHGHYAK